MSPLCLPAVSWLGSLLLAGGLGGSAVALALQPELFGPLARYRDRIDAGLARMLRPPEAQRLLQRQLACSAGLLLCVWLSGDPLWLAVFLPVFALPPVLIQRALTQRREAIEQQLDGWLMGLVSALRAAPALGDALESTIPLVQGALRAELRLVLRAFRLGTPLDEGLTAMARRVGSPSLAAALTTLRVARKTGGELGATLEKSADALREMARLEGVVRTQTASGRAQAFTISMLPAPLIALLQWMNPDYLEPLFHTALGRALFAIAAMLWLVAGLWARKIVEVDL